MTALKSNLVGHGHASDETMQRVSTPEMLIKPWKLPPRKTYVFKNANVVDPAVGRLISNATVRVSSGLIESVSTGPSVDRAEGDDVVIVDVAGKYVTPGLIDAHVHLVSVPGSASLDGSSFGEGMSSHLRQPFAASQSLRRGFTTVRDCGGATLALKESIADDVFPGPRVFLANRALSQSGGHGDRRGMHDTTPTSSCCGGGSSGGGDVGGLSVVCDGVPDCIRAARDQLRTGADFVKIMVGGGVASPADKLAHTQFTAAEIRAVVEVAESYGTFVTAHAYTPRAIRHAVDNGVRGIEHGNLIDEPTARLMARCGVWLTPTLVAYAAMADARYAGFLPPGSAEKNAEVLARGLESLAVAARAGVRMCYGSDLLGPLTAEQLGEFSIRRRVLTDVDILRAATVNPAEMLGQEHFLGRVDQGFAADLLIVTENPLEDVTVFDRPERCLLAVVKDGRVWESRWSKLPVDVTEPTQLIE